MSPSSTWTARRSGTPTEWDLLAAGLLARHAARLRALTKAIAEGAFRPDGVDPLEFRPDRILDGVEAVIDGRE
ncbi:hypothetical protein Shyhy01_43710 [Streptomyces hygroscopicus subsp. hygroscopicus]|nr:hypothetical protein [Streptomyces hygroscopicus]GLX51421.1 hypothetical protein Shyhy01_43710 [Streptomyces hygroscopicus subsp. hygroscopicus]